MTQADGKAVRGSGEAARPPLLRRSLRVGELMTREVVTLATDDDLGVAGEIMRLGHLRHLPVVDDGGRLVGLLTHRDLLRALADALAPFGREENRWFGAGRVARTLPAAAYMTRDLRVVSPEAPAAEAAIIMRDGKYGCVPVVDRAGRVAGIVTEADYLGLAILALAAAGPREGGGT